VFASLVAPLTLKCQLILLTLTRPRKRDKDAGSQADKGQRCTIHGNFSFTLTWQTNMLLTETATLVLTLTGFEKYTLKGNPFL